MWETVLLVVALVVAEELELWADGWVPEWEMGPTLDKVKPTDPVDVLIEDILDETDSLLTPPPSSGRNSEDEDDGARVPIEEPTG